MASAKITITTQYVVVDTHLNQNLVVHTTLIEALKDCGRLEGIAHICRIDTVTVGSTTQIRGRILTLPQKDSWDNKPKTIHDSWKIRYTPVPNNWWKK